MFSRNSMCLSPPLPLIYRTNVCVWKKYAHFLDILDEEINESIENHYWTYMQLQLWPLDFLLCHAVTMHDIRIWMAIYRNTRKPNLSKLSPSLPAIVHRYVDRHVNRVSMAVVDYFRYIWTSTEMAIKNENIKFKEIKSNSSTFVWNYWSFCQSWNRRYSVEKQLTIIVFVENAQRNNGFIFFSFSFPSNFWKKKKTKRKMKLNCVASIWTCTCDIRMHRIVSILGLSVACT